MDFRHVLHDQNIGKKREDCHRSRQDIYILKNGFQDIIKAVTVDISKDIKKAVTKDVPVNWS